MTDLLIAVIGTGICLSVLLFVLLVLLILSVKKSMKQKTSRLGGLTDGITVELSSVGLPKLSDVELVSEIGKGNLGSSNTNQYPGNFGSVYKGLWNATVVALKLLDSEEMFDEFIHEASLLSKLRHPNVVRFLGIFQTTQKDYIVLVRQNSWTSL